jgi:hypothetical protein
VICSSSNQPVNSINAALASLDPSEDDTIDVRGACKENVTITGFDRLKIIAQNGASISDASGGILAVVTIRPACLCFQVLFLVFGLCVLTSCGGGAGGVVTGSNDPGSNSPGFALTGSMHTPRSMHTATLFTNGKVLIAGGKDSSGNALAASELFDPSTGTFASTGNMNIARWGHTATLLMDGRVLVVGGGSGIAELFDPTTGAFTSTGNTSVGSIGHTATLIKDGKVLVAGGGTSISEVFDPTTGLFTSAGRMSTPRTGAAAILLNDGRVLITGGTDSNGSALGDLFDPATVTFTPTADGGTQALWLTSTLLTSGKVLLAGGETTTILSGGSTRCCVSGEVSVALGISFDPSSNNFAAASDLSFSRAYHTATLLRSNKVLIAGGASVKSVASGGKVHTTITPLSSAESFDSSTGIFAQAVNLTTPRSWHTATLLGNGQVLVAGGVGANGVVLGTAELYHSGNK